MSGSWDRQTDLSAGADAATVLAAARPGAVLGDCPKGFGESRGDAPRAGFELPFGVWYEVAERAEVVRVLKVWRTDRPADGDEPAGPDTPA